MNAEQATLFAAFLAILVTLGVAIVGWNHAVRAGRLAKKADTRADEAHALAKAAEERADRLEQISVERRDVAWKVLDTDDEALISVKNLGTDTAHAVTLAVDFEEEVPRQTVTAVTVEPTGTIDMNLAAAVSDEIDRQTELFNRRDSFVSVPGVSARIRIAWQSELGVPASVELGQRYL